MLWLAIIVFIYYQRYKLAKEKGCIQEWRVKVLTRYMWVISAVVLVYSIVIGYASKTFSENLICLKWESVLLALMSFMISPLMIRGLWRINKTYAVILPIICSILPVIYIPFATGSGVTETITLIGVGIVSIFAVGVAAVVMAIVAVVLVMMLIGFLSIPVVYAI